MEKHRASSKQESLQSELAQMRRRLDDETHLRYMRERELRDRERTVDQLQGTVAQERQARSKFHEEITQARIAYTEMQENINERQRRLEQEQQ